MNKKKEVVAARPPEPRFPAHHDGRAPASSAQPQAPVGANGSGASSYGRFEAVYPGRCRRCCAPAMRNDPEGMCFWHSSSPVTAAARQRLSIKRRRGRPALAALAALALLWMLLCAISLGAAPVCSYPIGIRSAPGDLPCILGSSWCEAAGNPLPSVRAQKNFLAEADLCKWAEELTADSLSSLCGSAEYLVWNGTAWDCTDIPGDATTLAAGLVLLAGSGGTGTGVVQGNDPRMSNSRTPTNHASTHASGGTDPLSGTIAANISGNALTASAFDHNPGPCSAGQFASDIGADGALTCGTPAGGVTGPGSSTDRAIPVWSGTGGAALLDSGLTVGATAERRLHWGNGAGILEFSSSLYLSTPGNAYSIEFTGGGHWCLWETSNAPCLRATGNGTVNYSFNSDTDTGMGHPATDQVALYAGGVQYLFTATTATFPVMLKLAPQASPPVTCDSAAEALEYYDSTGHVLCLCDGTAWSRVGGAAGGTCD